MSALKKPEHAELNEYAQKIGSEKPEYSFSDRFVGARKEFTATCKFLRNVTHGTAFNKNDAKRISAGNMLALLGIKNLCLSPEQSSAELATVTSNNKLADFDKKNLDLYLDQYLETREKDASKFRQLFVGGMPAENTIDESELPDDVDSPKSKTLEKLAQVGIGAVNSGNACSSFKAIVQEMKLNYFAEFLETAKNDRYAVVIKLNINFFTAGGMGDTPQKAIDECCKNAIQFLYLFNL